MLVRVEELDGRIASNPDDRRVSAAYLTIPGTYTCTVPPAIVNRPVNVCRLTTEVTIRRKDYIRAEVLAFERATKWPTRGAEAKRGRGYR
jgi:hypothetical protein